MLWHRGTLPWKHHPGMHEHPDVVRPSKPIVWPFRCIRGQRYRPDSAWTMRGYVSAGNCEGLAGPDDVVDKQYIRSLQHAERLGLADLSGGGLGRIHLVINRVDDRQGSHVADIKQMAEHHCRDQAAAADCDQNLRYSAMPDLTGYPFDDFLKIRPGQFDRLARHRARHHSIASTLRPPR